MPKILIITRPYDYHALAVQWGIEQLGGEVEYWMPTDLPDQLSVSISIGGDTGPARVSSRFDGALTELNDVDVVWNRRRGNPAAPPEASPFDARTIEVECLQHINNVLTILSASVPFVNDPLRQFVADQKANQLQVAVQVGFTIPRTLISNDFRSAKAFQRDTGAIISKPYKPHVWLVENGSRSQLTTPVPDLAEIADEAISYCPIIFQEQLERSCEVRVICFDGRCHAVKVVGDIADTSFDARLSIKRRQTDFTAVDLPPEISRRCGDYMKAMGLAFGAFDFMIDKSGKWLFLECNEAGQFLFLEERLPEVRLLDGFCRWLMSFGQRTVAPPGSVDISVRAFNAARNEDAIAAVQRKHKARSDNEYSSSEIEPA